MKLTRKRIKIKKKKKGGNNFRELIKEARNIVKLFDIHDPRPWLVEIKALDLASHTGSIAQAILEKQDYKSKGVASKLLGKELAIVLYIILDIADKSDIILENAFFELLNETRKNLTKK